MSPEQCKGEPIDPRSDQYSLGVLLHQLTTGRLPYSGETPMAIAIKHVNEPLTPPRKVTPNLPEAVERVLVKALAKDPHERFTSVAELNAAFQAALAGVVDRNGEVAPPRADPDHPTVPMSRRELLARLRGGRAWKWRRAAGLALLLTLVCAPLAWAMAVAPPAGLSLANGSGVIYVTPTDLMATIYALSTDLARPQDGDRLSSGEIATAVAGTLTARGALPTAFDSGGLLLGGTIEATEPVRPTVAFIPRTATPSRTPAGGGGATATASRTPTTTPTPTATEFGQPTDTPTRTPTRTPTPTDPPTPTPTPVTPPTPTPVTPPTPTPVTPPTPTPVTPAPPTPTPNCDPRKPPGHPHACPPTPTPG
jgi:serine/threonine-protein kinase